jgi:cytoskeletal protein RodZ
MKTVGQLLHGERIKKNISIEELSLATKIDGKYIEYLEVDRYDALPSETFIKGFIRNIALSLGCKPEEYIAVFRRDFKHSDNHKISSKKNQSHRIHLPHFSSPLLSLILGALVFVIYLVFQFRAILTPPPLTINKPLSGAILASPVDILGSTSSDSLVTINSDNVIKPDQNGAFQLLLNLPVGETSVIIRATNRFGKSKSITIPVTIISN